MKALGVEAEPQPDGIRIRGGSYRGGSIDSRGDHRIAMAASLLGLVAEGESIIDGAEAVELAVYKEGGTNTVTVSDSVRDRLESLGEELERSAHRRRDVDLGRDVLLVAGGSRG